MAKVLKNRLSGLLLSFGFIFSSLLSAEGEPCGSFGDSMSASAAAFSLADLLTSRSARSVAVDQPPISTRGVLSHGIGAPRHLCLSQEYALHRILSQCVLLDFDWQALDLDEEVAARIFAQWTGRWVAVSGSFAQDSGSEFGDGGRIRVHGITLIAGRQGIHASYCPGYVGPLQPSAEELWHRAMGLAEGVCRHNAWIGLDSGTARACLEDYEPVIWLSTRSLRHTESLLPQPSDERLAFKLPQHFNGRDIWEFAPLTRDAYLLTLVDGRLFAVVTGGLRQVETPKVDQLRRLAEPDVVYFRHRERATEDTYVSSLKVVDESLVPKTLWESDTHRLEFIKVVAGMPLALFVEDEFGSRIVLVQDANGGWVSAAKGQ